MIAEKTTKEQLIADAEFYAWIKKPNKAKRTCLKCRKKFKVKEGSRRVCNPCAVVNDRYGKTASYNNL